MHIRPPHPTLIALLAYSISVTACGQSHDNHDPVMSHGSLLLPVETGQSAFASLAEVVSILEADPKTDWSTVSIDTLRAHLVDMDRVTLSSTVNTQILDDQRISFQVTGVGRTLKAIQTMLPAHATMVSESTDWKIDVKPKPDGLTLVVDPGSPQALEKLKGLGFFGFMTIGAHHQLHHLQIATGLGH